MSKRGSKVPNLGKTPSKRPSIVSVNQAKPSTSNADSKELYSYTPNWITPQEKAKLKARVQQIKIKERRLTLKEDVLLLHASKRGSHDSTHDSTHDVSPERGKGKNKGKDKGKDKGKPVRSSSTSSERGSHSDDDDDDKIHKTKSDKSVKSEKSKTNLSGKDSKESTKKEKSKESIKKEKSKDSVKSTKSEKSEKGKSKEDLRMSKNYEEGHGKKHPKEAHANPSGNTVENKPQREISKTELDEHLWATDYAHFDPQLYHFKSPEKLSTKNPVMAECPPFWVLLDHTIAVTWKLFCQDAERNDLGIIPLQWSREFVSAMRDERGEYLPATGQLLSAIEDALIDRYAKASDADESEKPQKDDHERSNKKDCGKKAKGDCKKDHDSLSYVSSESIFKYPVEVSYTLKDIMSRNMPGRKHAEGEESGVQNRSDTAVHKVDVPPPEDHESMSRSDMLGYLKQLKQEQDLRVEKEKEHGEKIEALMELLAKGKINGDLWSEEHDSKKKHEGEHVHFDHDRGSKGAKSQRGDKGKADGKAKGGKEKDRVPAKEEKKERPVKYENKEKSAREDDHRKKKVSMEDDKKVKKGKDDKRKKSDASLNSRSSVSSTDSKKSTKSTKSKGSKKSTGE